MIGQNLCKVEDADYKVSVNLYNLPYGARVDEVLEFVNGAIESKINDLLDSENPENDEDPMNEEQNFIPERVVFDTSNQNKEKLLTKFSLVLRVKCIRTAIFLIES
jgi:hypothetical protein